MLLAADESVVVCYVAIEDQYTLVICRIPLLLFFVVVHDPPRLQAVWPWVNNLSFLSL